MKVNGAHEPLDKPMTLLMYLESHGYTPAHIAVERNGQIVSRGAFETTQLEAEDVLEIVRFVGGG